MARAVPAQSLTIHNGPVKLRATSYGDGQPVLLLHAGMERRTVWQPVAEGLARSGYRAIAMDQRGHGDSDRTPGRYRVADYVSDVEHALAHLDGERVVLAGGSLGGLAALLAAAHDQSRVAGLVLVDVVPAPDPTRTRAFLAKAMTAVSAPDDRAMCTEFIEDFFGRSAPALRRAARRLRVPTMLVHGAASPAVGPDELAQFRADVPHGQVRTVTQAGHLIARDQPDRLLRTLRAFLAGLSA